jgi:hypothetical protein
LESDPGAKPGAVSNAESHGGAEPTPKKAELEKGTGAAQESSSSAKPRVGAESATPSRVESGTPSKTEARAGTVVPSKAEAEFRAAAAFDAGVKALLAARSADPFGVLGPHAIETPEGRRWVVRFFRPGAKDASVVLRDSGERVIAKKIRNEGLFEAALPGVNEFAPAPGSYRIHMRSEYGDEYEGHDAYAFPFQLSEFDLYLMGEGQHHDTDRGWSHGSAFCGVGTERATRQRRGGLQPVGWAHELDACARVFGNLGVVYSRFGRRSDLQVRTGGAERSGSAVEGRSVWIPVGVAAEYGFGGRATGYTCVGRRGVD